jgi:ribosomal protein L32
VLVLALVADEAPGDGGVSEMSLCQSCGHMKDEHHHSMNFVSGMVEVENCWCCDCPAYVPEPPILGGVPGQEALPL